MGAASLRKAFFERTGLAFGDIPLDLFRQPFTFAARGEIPFQILIPRRFFHRLKPAGELASFLFRQMLDRFLDGFKRHTAKLAYAKRIVIMEIGWISGFPRFYYQL
jgi:hypothetical protein